MEFWIGAAIAAVIGFALGALVVWLIDRKRGGGTSVATLKQEHEQFREQVTTHFVETADLINKLTDSYKDVFDHLSKGAETLVDDKSLRDRMPRVSDQEVRLKRLGSRTPQAGSGDGAGSPSASGAKPGSATRSSSSEAERGPSRGEVKRANDPRPSAASSSAGTSSAASGRASSKASNRSSSESSSESSGALSNSSSNSSSASPSTTSKEASSATPGNKKSSSPASTRSPSKP